MINRSAVVLMAMVILLLRPNALAAQTAPAQDEAVAELPAEPSSESAAAAADRENASGPASMTAPQGVVAPQSSNAGQEEAAAPTPRRPWAFQLALAAVGIAGLTFHVLGTAALVGWLVLFTNVGDFGATPLGVLPAMPGAVQTAVLVVSALAVAAATVASGAVFGLGPWVALGVAVASGRLVKPSLGNLLLAAAPAVAVVPPIALAVGLWGGGAGLITASKSGWLWGENAGDPALGLLTIAGTGVVALGLLLGWVGVLNGVMLSAPAGVALAALMVDTLEHAQE